MAAKLAFLLGAATSLLAQNNTIVDIVCSDASLVTLCSIVSGFPSIVEALNGTGNFTLFAPSEGGFPSGIGNLTNTTIESILKYHVIDATVLSTDLAVGLQFPLTHNGSPLKILADGQGNVEIEFDVPQIAAKVTSPDNKASNGVVHIIDKLLLPPANASVVLSKSDDYDVLLNAIVTTGLGDAANKATTVFGPQNEYLVAAGAANFSVESLAATLAYHVIPGGTPLFSTEINATMEVATALGDTVTITKNGTDLEVNGKKFVGDVLTAGGVFQVLDGVLDVPFSVNQSILDNLKRQGPMTSLAKAVDSDAAVKAVLLAASDITLFGPTNEAFASHESQNVSLTALLTYHVASGAIPSSAIPARAVVNSSCTDSAAVNLGGNAQKLIATSDSDGVKINGQATVVRADLSSSGNVITHFLDTVLALPEKPADVLAKAGLDTLLKLVVDSGLADNVTNIPSITILAPSNAAFAEFLSSASPNSSEVKNLLLAHVFPSPVYSTMLENNMTIKSLAGVTYTVTIDNVTGAVKFAESSVTVADVLIWNGVVHVIDCVLGQTCSRPPAPAPSPSDDSGLSAGAVVGIVVGVLVGVALVGYCCFKSSKRGDYHQM